MDATARPARKPRPALSRERVIEGAVQVADEHGAAAVTMRKIAERLGVEAMSLYHHVANKDEILDAIVDAVFAEIDLPDEHTHWKAAMHERAASARRVLVRHVWALGLLESRRNPGPATLRHHDRVIGCLRGAGFSLDMAAHAFSAIDSYVYGFVLQETSLPFDTAQDLREVADGIVAVMPDDAYPHLAALIAHHVLQPGYAYADEFDFGLRLVLDGLERHLGS